MQTRTIARRSCRRSIRETASCAAAGHWRRILVRLHALSVSMLTCVSSDPRVHSSPRLQQIVYSCYTSTTRTTCSTFVTCGSRSASNRHHVGTTRSAHQSFAACCSGSRQPSTERRASPFAAQCLQATTSALATTSPAHTTDTRCTRRTCSE